MAPERRGPDDPREWSNRAKSSLAQARAGISSMASASDHMDHVRTQIPYALIGAGVAVAFYLVAA